MTERLFLPHPSSPAMRGSTSLLNTLASPKSFTLGNVQMHLTLLSLNQDFPILRREDLKPGRPGLYSQTSSNFVDFRLRSAEHSSELDALHLLARELRLFDARCASVDAPRARLRDVDRDCWYDRRGQRRTTL